MITSLVFSLLLISFVVGEEQCSANEKWTRCPGCEIKCGESEVKACTRECRPSACFCNPSLNLRRKADGSCVPATECSVQLGKRITLKGPIFVKKINSKGTDLRKTPSKVVFSKETSDGKTATVELKRLKTAPKVIIRKRAVPAVLIGQKTLPVVRVMKRTTNNVTKPLLLTPKIGIQVLNKCGLNEKWTECTGCELKCGQSENIPCPLMCRPPSCYCSPHDDMRRTADGRCVPVEKCPQPKRLPKNEEDEDTSEEEEEVKVKKCGLNEEWKECPGCEMKCSDGENTVCPLMCGAPACHCSAVRGFRRHENGSCIPADKCPTSSNSDLDVSDICDENEEWTVCGTCEGTCDKPRPVCTRECKRPRCQCNAAKGFVRDYLGNCIKLTDCKK